MTNKAARRHFLITASYVDSRGNAHTIDGTFATKTGGVTSADDTKVWDGGATEPDVLMGPANHSDCTIGRAWDRDRDAPILRELRPQVGRARVTVSVQPTDEDMVKYGDPEIYTGKLKSVTGPEPDAASSDAARLELVVSTASVK